MWGLEGKANLSLTTEINSTHTKRVSHKYKQEVKKCLDSPSPVAKKRKKMKAKANDT